MCAFVYHVCVCECVCVCMVGPRSDHVHSDHMCVDALLSVDLFGPICSGGGVPGGYLVMYSVLEDLKQTRCAKILKAASVQCIHRRCACAFV
jgi:hypothetical protein